MPVGDVYGSVCCFRPFFHPVNWYRTLAARKKNKTKQKLSDIIYQFYAQYPNAQRMMGGKNVHYFSASPPMGFFLKKKKQKHKPESIQHILLD